MATFYKNAKTGQFLFSQDAVETPAGYEAVEPNIVDAAVEKHVPVIDLQRDGHVIHVTVGEVEHPMTKDHLIEWIALDADGRFEVHHLSAGQTPTTFFAGGVKSGTVYAYCNLHGLWKTAF